MNNVHRAKLVVLLSLAGMFLVGCPNKNEERIRALLRDNQALRDNQRDLNDKLVNAREKEAELQIVLDNKDGQIVVAQARIKELEDAVKPTPIKRTDDDNGGGNGNGPRPKTRRWTVGGALFSSGQATLTMTGRRELNTIIDQLNRSYRGMPIRVLGHTDNQPIRKSKWKDNLQLSGARAMEVRRYMVAKGIPAEDIETIAMGSSDPVASNSTSAGRARNRRVEIAVIRK